MHRRLEPNHQREPRGSKRVTLNYHAYGAHALSESRDGVLDKRAGRSDAWRERRPEGATPRSDASRERCHAGPPLPKGGGGAASRLHLTPVGQRSCNGHAGPPDCRGILPSTGGGVWGSQVIPGASPARIRFRQGIDEQGASGKHTHTGAGRRGCARVRAEKGMGAYGRNLSKIAGLR